MALDRRLALHDNPIEKFVVWEKRHSLTTSKHRARSFDKLKSIESIVVKDEEDKNDVVQDYCVLVSATKDTRIQEGRPVAIRDRDCTHYSTSRYNTFAKKHITGSIREPTTPSTITQQHYDTRCTNYDENQLSNDAQIFCCNRDVECIIDYTTCMCCVKGLAYHCTKDSYEEGDIAENPCTCERGLSKRSCFKRWVCLALCSIFLPCIFCYPPSRCCLRVCTCYKQHRTAKRQRGRIKNTP